MAVMADPAINTWEEAVAWLRAQPDQQRLVEACFYDDPLLGAGNRYWNSTEWKAIRAYVGRPPGRALDIGAGRGISAYAFAKDGWTATALEPDPSDLVGAGAIRALAREGGVDIDVVQTWGETLPFETASFDVVHARQVLHHARDLKDLCAQMARVLRPGGVLIATREPVISRQEDLQQFLDSHPLHRLYGGEHAYLLAEYVEAIERAGLKIEHRLNRLESDINLYPDTTDDVRKRMAQKLRLPWPGIIPDYALKLAGSFGHVPGRLYTFVARKPKT